MTARKANSYPNEPSYNNSYIEQYHPSTTLSVWFHVPILFDKDGSSSGTISGDISIMYLKLMITKSKIWLPPTYNEAVHIIAYVEANIWNW